MDVLSWAVLVEWGASFFFHELIKNKENTEGVCMTSFQRVLLLVGAVAGVGGDRRLLQSASLWPGLGWGHLAGLRLGDSGRGLFITKWNLATAEGSEHAVPELEGRRCQSGPGPTTQPSLSPTTHRMSPH